MFLAILLVLYPIIPSVALIVLLWVRPKDKSSGMRLRAMSSFRETMKNNIIKPDPETPKKKDYDFRDVDFLAMIAHAIAGGVESPLQLTFQVQKNVLNNVYILASFKLIKVIVLQKISSL